MYYAHTYRSVRNGHLAAVEQKQKSVDIFIL